TLTSFRHDAGTALDAARRAEALGLDGVFVFDHLWPMGHPARPALSAFPLLGAVAAVTSRICLGPLVARVGLVPDDVLVAQMASLANMAPGRLVAGMGTGDSKSALENAAFGIAFGNSGERRKALRACARRVLDMEVPVWIGGGSTATLAIAAELGAAVNLWEGDPSSLATLRDRSEVTWAGQVPGDTAGIVERLGEVSRAGATWAVCAWPDSLHAVSEAVEVLRGA
ncbi:MAG: LLM class flavin-dependent oxidoreductase, partial [Acidimicrobiales bacterium]